MRIIFSAVIFFCLSALQSFAQDCTSRTAPSVPEVTGVDYPQARASLIASGWQPFLDRKVIEAQGEPKISEKWAHDAGYFEMQSCSGTGLGYCRANFVSKDRVWLRVITVTSEAEANAETHPVERLAFVCGPDD